MIARFFAWVSRRSPVQRGGSCNRLAFRDRNAAREKMLKGVALKFPMFVRGPASKGAHLTLREGARTERLDRRDKAQRAGVTGAVVLSKRQAGDNAASRTGRIIRLSKRAGITWGIRWGITSPGAANSCGGSISYMVNRNFSLAFLLNNRSTKNPQKAHPGKLFFSMSSWAASSVPWNGKRYLFQAEASSPLSRSRERGSIRIQSPCPKKQADKAPRSRPAEKSAG